MASLFADHHNFWNERNKKSFYVGILLLILALVVQVSVGRYAYRKALSGQFVGDLILDNLPTIDLTLITVQGSIVAVLIGALLFGRYPRYLLFGIKAVAIFIIVRALFVALTHIGIYPSDTVLNSAIGSGIYNVIDYPGNYFFSGHVGLPFLIALIFWHKKRVRFLFLGISFLLGVGVLVSHLHYSIDVFAAPFMAYAIFKISQWLFSSDYGLIRDGTPA